MADLPNSTETTDQNSQPPGTDNPNTDSTQPDLSIPPPSSPSIPATNPNPSAPPLPAISQAQIQSYAHPQVSPLPPLFRPVAPPVPLPTVPQFSPLPNQNFQNPGVQPPGVSPLPVMMQVPPASGVGSATVSSVPQYMSHYGPPGQLPNQGLRPPYVPMPNGYQNMSMPVPQGTIPPPEFVSIHAGILRYPSPYGPMMRPGFPPRPLGIIPMPRPPVLGIRGPIIPPVVRPAIMPIVTPTEKPQTTVYVGKIASTVENDFMLSLLQLCGPVKSWKRPQDSTTGALKGFGLCEFESAEGVLRALRLLSKLNVDGQELMLNVNQATKEYLEKKKEYVKNLKGTECEGGEKEELSDSGPEKNETPKPSDDSKEDKSDEANKENKDSANFGLVTDEDRQADQEASEKISAMLEERLKTKPLPPPPPPPPQQAAADGSGNLEPPAKSKDGDSDVDIMRNDAGEDRNDEEMTSDSKPPSVHDKPEASSPDRGRRTDRRSRDHERDLKREKERELERYEREREQDRAKRERERENKIREDERRYRARLKEWESREKEKERARKEEKEWEKEKELDRKYEVMDQERDSDDGYSKKRKYKSSGGEREERKRRQREREEDMADRVKEEEEIAEAKRRYEEERELQKEHEKHALELLSSRASSGTEKDVLPDVAIFESKEEPSDQMSDGDFVHGSSVGNGVIQNGSGDESVMEPLPIADARQSNSIPSRKLGFGLVGSGKRTAVPSVFHEEEDEDAQKEKKMRPLVPIDYSTEELQAVRDTSPVAPSTNLAAAAEFAKRIGNVNSKEVRADSEKERSRRHNDRPSQRERERERERERDRDRNGDETSRTRDESKKESDWDKDRDRGDKVKTPENKKLMDAKQLIDTIPKTKDELFSYEINWSIYDKNGLHERMRPWISKKITEYLGEEEPTLVDYIVSTTGEHITATEMLKKLELILDDEAEMFVLKMWRMLIFEVKRVETGLASRSKA